MTGVLVAAHGSRAKETEETLNKVVKIVRDNMPEVTVEIGYMEFCEETIEGGLLKLVDRGVTEIKVVPYFLFEGIHIREDIPEELDKFAKTHPQVKIQMGKTLGADSRLADILTDRIKEVL